MTVSDSAKTIVCYGDSNTWGRFPLHERYPRSERFTTILQELLGDKFEVISEGLPGRTFVAEDPTKPYRTGITHLKSILESHKPIDAVIVMLGTNDMKVMYNLQPKDIAEHLDKTIQFIKEDVARVIVVCPPEIIQPENRELDPAFVNGPVLSKALPALYKAVAEKHACVYINAQDYISSSKADGFHLDPEAHKKLAEVLSERVLSLG